MKAQKSDLVTVCTVQGELMAQVIKSHLESEGVPVLLKYESLGSILGIIADGLGQVKIMVPQSLYEIAVEIINPEKMKAVENRNIPINGET